MSDEPIMHKLYFANPPEPVDPRPYEEKEAQVVAFWEGLCADGSMPMKEAMPNAYKQWADITTPEERRLYVEHHVKWANVDMR
jgi:hypothetical protein